MTEEQTNEEQINQIAAEAADKIERDVYKFVRREVTPIANERMETRKRQSTAIIQSAIERAVKSENKRMMDFYQGQREIAFRKGQESRAARASETNQIVVESEDDYGEENVCAACGGEGRITTADYESYLGAMYKPCPECSENPCIGEPPLST